MGFIKDRKRWETLLNRFPEANFLQSWAWGEFHRVLGHPVYRVSQRYGIFQAIVEPAKRARYLTVPGGPLVHEWNVESLTPVISELKRIARDERCSFIRIRPQIFDSPSSRFTLRAFGFRPSPMHLHAETTRIIDLTKSDDQLLSEMRKSTRYEIRKAHKLKILVEQSTDERLIDRFIELQDETSRREHFVPFSKEYLLEQFRAFKEEQTVRIFYVSSLTVIPGHNPESTQNFYRSRIKSGMTHGIIAMAFIIFYRHEAVYHYAASSRAAREIPAAYAIQWAIIQEAKKRGCTTYNLWGDVPDEKLRDHRFAGPSLFKRGFGGEQVVHIHAHDLPLLWKYWMNWIVERIRKGSRNL